MANQQKQKGKSKAKRKNWADAPLNVWSRNLFQEEFSQPQSNPTVVYDEDCGMLFCSINFFGNII